MFLPEVSKHGYFGDNFVPNSLSIDSQTLSTVQTSVQPMTTFCSICPQKLPIQTKTNPYVIQTSGKGDIDWLFEGDDDDDDEVDTNKLQNKFDDLFDISSSAKERDTSLHTVSGDVVAELDNTFKTIGTVDNDETDEDSLKFEFDEDLLDEDLLDEYLVDNTAKDKERQQLQQQLQTLELTDQQIKFVENLSVSEFQELHISKRFKQVTNAIELNRQAEQKLETWKNLDAKHHTGKSSKSQNKNSTRMEKGSKGNQQDNDDAG